MKVLALVVLALFASCGAVAAEVPEWMQAAKTALETELLAKHGEAQRDGIRRG